jgi:hypothetical protein
VEIEDRSGKLMDKIDRNIRRVKEFYCLAEILLDTPEDTT